MKSLSRLTIIALLASAFAQAAPAQAPPQPSQADRQLKALYEGYADWTQKEFGFFPDAKGENQPAGYLPRVDPATQLAQLFALELHWICSVDDHRAGHRIEQGGNCAQ